MKRKIQILMKLFLLFEFIIIVNSLALKAYEYMRFYQFDLNNDYIFSQTESSLDNFEIWSSRFYNDLGDNLLILFSPLISLILSLLCLVADLLLQKTAFFQKLDMIRYEPFNTKKLVFSFSIFTLIVIFFFVTYSISDLSENSILRQSDYIILLFCCYFLFFGTIISDIVLGNFFYHKCLIKVLWCLLVIKTFLDILNDIISFQVDSFLYLLIPIAGVIPCIMNKRMNKINIER